ncbi:MAG: prephenate dehydratase [Alphaproteobacteria bacterium]|nr:prephenate dehydratase [Alphaproteobacteria bacterium]
MMKKIAFQGEKGAYSNLACMGAFPDYEAVPCPTFGAVFSAAKNGEVDLAMIPIENSLAGRVADIHHLLPNSGLHIIGEHYQRVEHHLLVCEGASVDTIKTIHSHEQALSQCRGIIKQFDLEPVTEADTAGAAEMISKTGDITKAAIASSLSGEIYGLKSLKKNIEDQERNTTRFIIMSRESSVPQKDDSKFVTSFIFKVKNIPAALYKSLGGFATNGVNMTKLESYLGDGTFVAAQFYSDVEGHPDDVSLQNALEELNFFSSEVTVLGTYKAHPYRSEAASRVL